MNTSIPLSSVAEPLPDTVAATLDSESSTTEPTIDPAAVCDPEEIMRMLKEGTAAGLSVEDIAKKLRSLPVSVSDTDGTNVFQNLIRAGSEVSKLLEGSGDHVRSLERTCGLSTVFSKSAPLRPLQKAAIGWLKAVREYHNGALEAQVAFKRLEKRINDTGLILLDPAAVMAAGEEASKKANDDIKALLAELDNIIQVWFQLLALGERSNAAQEKVIAEHSKVCQCSLPCCAPAWIGMTPGLHVSPIRQQTKRVSSLDFA